MSMQTSSKAMLSAMYSIRQLMRSCAIFKFISQENNAPTVNQHNSCSFALFNYKRKLPSCHHFTTNRAAWFSCKRFWKTMPTRNKYFNAHIHKVILQKLAY